MKRVLLCLMLISLPVLAFDQEQLFDARIQVLQAPDKAISLADQVLADKADGLAFQALLLKGWALLAKHASRDSMDPVLDQLKTRAAAGTDPLQKADYAYLKAKVLIYFDSDLNRALPLLEEAMSYCRPFNQLRAYQYCAEISSSAAHVYAFIGDLDKARNLISDSYRFAKLGGRNNIYLELKLLEAALARRQNQPAQSLTLLKETELEAEQLGDKLYQGKALSRQGMIYAGLGQYKQAEQAQMDALALFQKLDDQDDLAISFRYLGELMLATDRPQLALVQFYNALDIVNRLGQAMAAGQLLMDIGQGYLSLGKLDKAEAMLTQAKEQLTRLQGSLYLPKANYQLGKLYLAQHQDDKAALALQAAIDGAEANPTVERELHSKALQALAGLYESQGQYQKALEVTKTLANLNSGAKPSQITVKVSAPPPAAPPAKEPALPPLAVALGLALGAGGCWLGLAGWRRHQRQRHLAGAGQHPATGFMNINAFLQEGDQMLSELRLAMDLSPLSAGQANHQPLAAVLCRLSGMAEVYESLGFQETRRRFGHFAKQLTLALPEARMLVQPSRDLLLFVLSSPGYSQEDSLTMRLRQILDKAARQSGLDVGQQTLTGTLLPLLPYHPRVGSAMTVLETLLFAQHLAALDSPQADIWVIGLSCTLPSALAEPVRDSLGEAIQKGTIKVTGLPYSDLMQRLQQLNASQETFAVNWPNKEQALPIS
ncbi:tetratricopeptide repeat protein [Gallaecimonas kandeliae]|uniref:tetratricopeptide repeat protein n=1 Tax=Gallaecimonas kandeliae TaxID=3029055 RepID=UPI002648457C|nr:tetratricopeptide repeat protein [Gallaecimonas kandeliae]WKE64544.1 tetratricopeptide repeat protein [Gallaecimonas kandeliae]